MEEMEEEETLEERILRPKIAPHPKRMKEKDNEEPVFNLELADNEETEENPKMSPLPTVALKNVAQEEIKRMISECKELVTNFLDSYKCHYLIPESGKIVVLDTSLAVKSAFRALEENNIKSAPLWDSTVGDYVGLITVSDFIEILLHFHYQSPNINVFEELEKHKIKTWRDLLSSNPSRLIYTGPEDTLLEASKILLKHRIHRLPIIDREESNSILYIMTHFRILSFIVEGLRDKPDVFKYSIESLGIGTYKNVVTVLSDTPLHIVLNLLAQRKISAVPVVDENGSVIDIYCRSDVTSLIKYVTFNFLDTPVGDILEYKKKEKIYTCYKSETLAQVLRRLIETRVYRLVCVDNTNRVEGIISLSDILQCFIT